MDALQKGHAELRERGIFKRKAALPELHNEDPDSPLAVTSEVAGGSNSWSSRLVWLFVGLVLGVAAAYSSQPLVAALLKLS
jgi:hypothetical protein